MPNSTPIPLQKTIIRVVQVMLVAIVLYFGFAVWSGLRALGGRLSYYTWWTFFVALGLAFSNYILRFFKWQFYLKKLHVYTISPYDSFLIFLSGFVLSITPGKIGEMFKSIVLQRTHHVPAVRTAPIVIAERLTDLIGIIMLIIIGSSRFKGGFWWATAGALCVALLLVIIASRNITMKLIKFFEYIPTIGLKLSPKLRESYESLYVLTRPKLLIFPTLVSIVAWFLEALALWIIVYGFKTHISVLGASFFYATSTLAGALIPVPGGLGVAETVMQTLLHQVGNLDVAGATGAMLLVRFATLWFAVLVGFVALFLLRQKYRL